MIKDDFISDKFGESGQLTVIGWNGERTKCGAKVYKLHCVKCAQDPELFGDGYFYSVKSKLIRGVSPCGCAKNPRWSEYQYKIRIKRKCQEYGDLEFLGFCGEFKGNKTKLRLRCNKHEEFYEYTTCTIFNLFSGNGCPKCREVNRYKNNLKPDQEMIESFFDSGSFKKGTKFWRLNKEDYNSRRSYWKYICPVCSNDEYTKEGLCNGVFSSISDNLQKGALSCRCSNYHWSSQQREYQINKRIKEENLPYIFICWVNIYKNAFSKFSYKCQKHGNQITSVNTFLNQEAICPQCAGQNQQECYINGVYDSDVLVALKFGVTNNSIRRKKEQNRESIFEVKQLKVFSFPSVELCKAAEAACKGELVCGILSKQEMPDGYTETTSPLNMEKIISIYKRFDGIENK